MNNFENCLDIDIINSQLERADVQKNRLICNIYKEYELYLKLVRDLLYISVEKGLNELYGYLSIKDNFQNTASCFCPLEKEINKIIYTFLPLLTVEQLKINEIENNLNKEIKVGILGDAKEIKNDQKEKYKYEDAFQFEEPIQFRISEDISYPSGYYPAKNYEKFVSLDLDSYYSSKHNITENFGLEKQFISSLLELKEEIKAENPKYADKNDINLIDISAKHQSLKTFDLIDKSLENLLLNLSYKINQELYNSNFIKKIISKDSFEYLIMNKLLIKHPQPFLIIFEFNMNQSSSIGDNLSSIIFMNISTVELEFKNLNLSIIRNKINELKKQFQRLIKKETYWKQKEMTLNKIR